MSSTMGAPRRRGSRHAPAVLAIFILLFLAACQGRSGTAAALPLATMGAPAAAPTGLPPAVVETEATEPPAFRLPTAAPPTATVEPAEAISMIGAAATESVTTTKTVTATDGVTLTAPTATPQPTFTPPALPNTSPNEHYWFRRPVAEGGTVWTDKHYPYGSTLGGQLRTHHGVEFNVPYNTEILSAATGTVSVAGNDAETAYGPHTNFYGNLVVIEHDFQLNGQPVFTLYGHLNEVLVSVGQHVDAREVIGLSGATGVADGPHMHFEVRLGANDYGRTHNPLLWLYPFPDRGTVAGRVIWPDGSPVEAAPVSLNRIDGDAPYSATTTYADGTVNGDPGWNENFAIDDVYAGYYEVIVNVGSEKVKTETWVHAYQTSFVEIVLE
ncbi:MAG: peptidoglycan DD-metalloendopeptidase family protein [Candidatus Promineifilaceae bacterium]|nr:peptidoglycan DD-metalloendopeptidase family protein [Candidatus Promineifilaceae bacterium]